MTVPNAIFNAPINGIGASPEYQAQEDASNTFVPRRMSAASKQGIAPEYKAQEFTGNTFVPRRMPGASQQANLPDYATADRYLSIDGSRSTLRRAAAVFTVMSIVSIDTATCDAETCRVLSVLRHREAG